METTTAFNHLHLQVVAMVLNKGKHLSFLHSIQKHVYWTTDFYLASVLSCTWFLLSILRIKVSWSQPVFPGKHPGCPARSHGTDTWLSQQSDGGPKAPSALRSKHAIHSFILWGLLAISIPLLRLVEAAGRWSKSLSVSYFKHSKAFEAGSHELQLKQGPFRLDGL